MKRMKLIYTLLLVVTLPLLTACYNDDATIIDDPTQQDGKITVRFRVSSAAPSTTRAGEGGWKDNNAEDNEMMNVWTVVAVKAETEEPAENTEESVANIWACYPSSKPDQEIDFVATLSEAGDYRFYSFANMSPKKVMELLGITSTEEINSFTSLTNDDVKSFVVPTNAKVNYTEVQNKTVNVEGNGFNKFTSGDDNGFGSYGIPMSNVQYFTLNEGDEKDLIVVRMLAKIELRIYNDKNAPLNIKSITLTDITQNDNQLKLFPYYTKGGADTMESNDGYHGDIQPYPDWNPGRKNVVLTCGEGDIVTLTEQTPSTSSGSSASSTPSDQSNLYWEIPADSYNEGNGTPVKITFYVNESATPTNDFKHFFLELEVEGDNYVGNTKARYTMIDDSNAEGKTGKWDYIARNDYRIIPIVLDDYKLDMIPYDFPAIGVYPASVKEESGIYTINFHDYGHFHLVPQVTKYSDTNNPKKLLPYGNSSSSVTDKTYWTLVESGDDNFSKKENKSWGAWTDAMKGTTYDNNNETTGGFYRKETTPATVDADNAGGVPVWYNNTNSPIWSADGYEGPFIFGYIADPGENIKNGDKKVYHEFSILLHKDGDSNDVKRVMTYRLYMILDSDQMLYRNSTSRGVSAPRCPHHWH